MDLLTQVQTVFKAALPSLKFTFALNNVERIPDVKAISIEYDFPAIGIMDGGETIEIGASVSHNTVVIIIAVYVKALKDNEKCIEEVRAIIDNCIVELRKKEHYRTAGAFEGFTRAWCNKKSEIKLLFENDGPLILITKLARIEFKKQEVITK
jgi:hypothetical protein